MIPDLSKGPETTSIRTFLAITPPNSEQEKLAALESTLKTHARILRWSPPERIHITVRFLGEVSGPRLPSIVDAARDAVRSVAPFHLSFAGIGAFPNVRVPRVLWIALAPGPGLTALRRMVQAVEQELVSRGFTPEERRFSPHVTLARVRERATSLERRALGEELARLLDSVSVNGSFWVDRLDVMRSDFQKFAHTYTPIATIPLPLDQPDGSD